MIAGRCLTCDTRRWSRFVHRELVLLAVLVGVTVTAFFGTRTVAHGNDALRRRQAAAWFDAAQHASRTGSAEAAVAGLRRAAAKDPENTQYRLALAGALAAMRLDEEARRVLLALREAQPEDPQANLQLARLEARGADAEAARRYYQNAVAGLWRPEQADERRRVRIELVEFLLAHEERARALSELLVLGANLPQDASVQTRAAQMFLAAGDPRLALDHFARALRVNPESAEALAGAGEAAFQLADYNRALRYLNAAPRGDARIAELREVARLYAQLLGGREFEPGEENPMLGFRGASRYYDERYAEGFALECAALARTRRDLGLTNVKAMIPFCRTVDEGRRVLDAMAANGLQRARMASRST